MVATVNILHNLIYIYWGSIDHRCMATSDRESGRPFIPKHGGYRRLRSYQKAQIVYDGTVYFCNRWIERGSRTRDQMIQAARSGKQNIVEGSMASATSSEMEIKLTGVARASLEELLEDYRDFLRVRSYLRRASAAAQSRSPSELRDLPARN